MWNNGKYFWFSAIENYQYFPLKLILILQGFLYADFIMFGEESKQSNLNGHHFLAAASESDFYKDKAEAYT